jgi:hypothetical protein
VSDWRIAIEAGEEEDIKKRIHFLCVILAHIVAYSGIAKNDFILFRFRFYHCLYVCVCLYGGNMEFIYKNS